MQRLAILAAVLLTGCSGLSEQPNKASNNIVTYYDYQLYSPEGVAISTSHFVQSLDHYDVVLVGEWHTHPAIHLFQTQLLQNLQASKTRLALSMEQFSRDKQKTLDQYLTGEIGEQTLISEGNGWPNYESDYRALVEFSKANQIDVIAANAPKPIVRCIGQNGLTYLESLEPEKRAYVAESIDVSDTPYKQKFMASLHHGKPEDNQNNYAAQVTWDETMAESIVHYLEANPDYRVMHIAGKFHTEDGLGIAASIRRMRPDTSIAVITPVAELADNTSDFQLKVLPPPIRYVKKDNQIKAIHNIMARKTTNSCSQ